MTDEQKNKELGFPAFCNLLMDQIDTRLDALEKHFDNGVSSKMAELHTQAAVAAVKFIALEKMIKGVGACLVSIMLGGIGAIMARLVGLL
ncbi:MAG: hypothetical protein O3A47_04115 [Chloroflexi bacterium]|nr:hypothetical protein [Chloroflexota bacterium]